METIPEPAAPSITGRTLLSRLRAETREDHERLERDLNLLRADLTLASYRNLVERFYGFYAPWEYEMTPMLPGNLAAFFEERRKVPKLWADLRFLGCESGNGLPLCQNLPGLSSMPRILGSWYVVEGATLGGQLISRHLERTLNLQNGCGYAFFSSYGSCVSAMWQAFRDVLLAYSPEQDDDLVVDSAVDTFRCLQRWLCRNSG